MKVGAWLIQKTGGIRPLLEWRRAVETWSVYLFYVIHLPLYMCKQKGTIGEDAKLAVSVIQLGIRYEACNFAA